MTRETKIGLLVGLCFIIVIGILLSDHFRSTMEPPEAALVNAGQYVRQGVNSPGTGAPPINFVAPQDAPPQQQVPTHEELAPQPSPVVPSPVVNNTQAAIQPPQAASPGNQIAGADAPKATGPLADAAREHGEQIVPANIDGTSGVAPAAPSAPGSAASYRAQSGDTVSRMAAKFLGSSSHANVQAIVDANPSLRDDPDTVIVGKTYIIPTRDGVAAQQNIQTTATAIGPSTPGVGAGEYVYTVQEGDSLWRIANDQLGDPSAVSALKALNSDVLKGQNHEVVTPGMKLRLPAKPVASAS